MNKKITVTRFYLTVGTVAFSFAALMIFFTAVNPEEAGFALTTIPLLLIWLFVFSTIRSAFYVFQLKYSVVSRVASLIAPSVLVLTLMFSALGEVSVLDGLLLFVLAALGNFYLARTWPK